MVNYVTTYSEYHSAMTGLRREAGTVVISTGVGDSEHLEQAGRVAPTDASMLPIVVATAAKPQPKSKAEPGPASPRKRKRASGRVSAPAHVPKRFTLHGPFDVPVSDDDQVYATECRKMWDKATLTKLRGQRGCYVFALRRGPGFLPVYVGKTSRSFEAECFQPHKILVLRDALHEERYGSLVLFLVSYAPTRGALNRRAIADLERYLIATAYAQNRNLQNRKTAKLPSFTVPGLTDPAPGKPSKTANAFRQMLGVEAPP